MRVLGRPSWIAALAGVAVGVGTNIRTLHTSSFPGAASRPAAKVQSAPIVQLQVEKVGAIGLAPNSLMVASEPSATMESAFERRRYAVAHHPERWAGAR